MIEVKDFHKIIIDGKEYKLKIKDSSLEEDGIKDIVFNFHLHFVLLQDMLANEELVTVFMKNECIKDLKKTIIENWPTINLELEDSFIDQIAISFYLLIRINHEGIMEFNNELTKVALRDGNNLKEDEVIELKDKIKNGLIGRSELGHSTWLFIIFKLVCETGYIESAAFLDRLKSTIKQRS